jgi:chromate reductase, NAD(P)H dehydrogenase (quinone)
MPCKPTFIKNCRKFDRRIYGYSIFNTVSGIKNIVALCGSTRQYSSNHNLINTLREMAKEKLSISLHADIDKLPHFNPDLDAEGGEILASVAEFRNAIQSADGILICTPEYAMGVPGTLKNAIDWTVSSCQFLGKPTALITASSLGEKGHASLMETLHILDAHIPSETQLIISGIRNKLDAHGNISDDATFAKLNALLTAFTELVYATPKP